MRPETKAIHTGEEPNFKEGGFGDVVIPIHLSSTFARKQTDKPTSGYEYSRTANPTRDALESRLAAIEGAKFALAFASGLAAESTLLVTLLNKGDHIIACDDLYGGTKRLFNTLVREKLSCEITYVDATKSENIESALKGNSKMVWLESPTNPLLKLCDIEAISGIARKRGCITIVDNTFATPCFQNPLQLGADIVVHSTTKYINGHSDSIGGAVMLNDENIYQMLKFNQNAIGAILSPFDSFMVLRGIKTLFVRMRQHEANAREIVNYLKKHPKIDKVYYPGLPDNPQYAIARKQMKGFGGMVSFEIKGDINTAKKFVESLNIIALAESLGGVESLVEIPACMTHAGLTKEEREKVGIKDNLIRLSVGIEDVQDLLDDLESALEKI